MQPGAHVSEGLVGAAMEETAETLRLLLGLLGPIGAC